jgi:hypothetical protein
MPASPRLPDGPVRTVNHILRCKKCKTARTVELTVWRRFTHTDRVLGVNHYKYEEKYNGASWDVLSAVTTPPHVCPKCQGMMHGKTVRGVKSDHECDAKCMASTGFLCECSCAGKNHGKFHAF